VRSRAIRSAIAGYLAQHLRQLADQDAGAGADGDPAFSAEAARQEDAGIGQIVHMEEFAPRRAGVPADHLRRAGQPRLVEMAHQAGDDVAALRVETVIGAIQIARSGHSGLGGNALARRSPADASFTPRLHLPLRGRHATALVLGRPLSYMRRQSLSVVIGGWPRKGRLFCWPEAASPCAHDRHRSRPSRRRPAPP
jgi:hypothetical protein